MAAINDLISQIEDKNLRERIEAELDKITKQKKFGLVFEEHLPECVPLYDVPLRRGNKVSQKGGKINEIYTVMQIEGENVWCVPYTASTGNGEKQLINFLKKDLVCVAEFGEPIYPYLKLVDAIYRADETPKQVRGDNSHAELVSASPTHAVIQADNYHALQLLEYLYAGKVDCIYIDPPYNTGARDWKYNNDYVDSSDSYRHSKWLSMMKKRLLLAKKLLNPADSVMIVTIDEKEYLHLGCLLEELFPEARIQMVSSVINPSGVSRGNEFYRTDEYIFFVKFGSSSPEPIVLEDEWITAKTTGKDKLRWRPIRRQGSHDTRQDAWNQFYPIFLTPDGKHFAGTGESLPQNLSWQDFEAPKDKITLWPLKPDGTEGCWQISQDSFKKLSESGYTKISFTKKWGYVPQYLAEGERKKVEKGQFPILGKAEDGSIITADAVEEAPFIPGTQWRISSHSAREFGSSLINNILGEKRFSFPKSLYAVHDALRFFVANKPNALIVDFFAGSGTTLHAVNLLNAEDALATGKQGKRQCVLVTNNEVSEDEAKALRAKGFNPGDEAWEKLGIAQYVTWPRTVCAIKGEDINGNDLKGNYIGSDIPMADGFKANAVFFKLGFLDKTSVQLGRQFKELLPLLWLKAGGWGKCPYDEPLKRVQGDSHAELVSASLPSYLILPENHLAVLINEAHFSEFEAALQNVQSIETAYIITDFEKGFKAMSKALHVKKTYQLYRDYLDNFRINVERN